MWPGVVESMEGSCSTIFWSLSTTLVTNMWQSSVTTNACVCHNKTPLLSRHKCVCFVVTKLSFVTTSILLLQQNTAFVATNMSLSQQTNVCCHKTLSQQKLYLRQLSPANDTNGWWGSWLIQCLKGRPIAVPRLTAGYRIVGIIALEENLCCLCSVSRRVALAGIGGNIFWQRSAVKMTVTCAAQRCALDPTPTHPPPCPGCRSKDLRLLQLIATQTSTHHVWRTSLAGILLPNVLRSWLWWLQMCSWCVLDCPQCQPFCFTYTKVRLLIRDGDGGGGGKRMKEWRLDCRYHPKKTGETMDHRQNSGSVKAVSPRHCAVTSALCNCCFNCRVGQSQGQCPLHCCWGTTQSKRSPTFKPSSTSLLMISSGLTWGSSSTSPPLDLTWTL